jgi:putative membrane protein
MTRGDTFAALLPSMIILALLTFGLTYAQIKYFQDLKIFKDAIAVYSLVGFVLSLLLVFRTNTAYDRWWEGRKKWGELVNDTRSLALKVVACNSSEEDRMFFHRMIPNYVHVLRWHLRKENDELTFEGSDEMVGKFTKSSHKPSFVAMQMYDRLKVMRDEERLTETEYLALDINLNNFSNITGACERILNTPMPYSYNLFLKKFIFIYVTTLPLGFVSTFGYGTILIACFMFYILVSMEILAEEIEDPFGKDDNDLPLLELCNKITDNVQDILTVDPVTVDD